MVGAGRRVWGRSMPRLQVVVMGMVSWSHGRVSFNLLLYWENAEEAEVC